MTNILFFYANENDRNHVTILKNVLNNLLLDSTDSLSHAQNLYNEHTYELVIVDFTKSEGKDLLSYITQHNPKQKIITMSDNLECSVLKGCEFCMQHLKRKRVFKPLNLKELTHAIKNYDTLMCQYMNKFNNIIYLLKDIITTNYNHFVYDEQEQTIYPKESYAESLIVEELVHITELLQNNEIPYSVNETYKIKLLT